MPWVEPRNKKALGLLPNLVRFESGEFHTGNNLWNLLLRGLPERRLLQVVHVGP